MNTILGLDGYLYHVFADEQSADEHEHEYPGAARHCCNGYMNAYRADDYVVSTDELPT